MDKLNTTTSLQPEGEGKLLPSNALPAAQSAQPEIIIGSQLALSDYKEKAKKRKYLVLAITATVVILLCAGAWFIFANRSDESPKDTVAKKTQTNNQTTKSPQVVSPPELPKYKDIDYSTATHKYRISYLSSAKILFYCETGAGKDSCNPPSTPNTMYLGASSAGRQTLLFSITEDPRNNQLSSTCETAFSVVLNAKQTEVCKVTTGNGVLYYGFAFTIKGARQVGTFVMDNQAGRAFYDASVYEAEIKEIIPSIRVYQ